MQAGDIDIAKFNGHNTRATSSSHLAACNFNIQENVSTVNLVNRTLTSERQSSTSLDVNCYNLLTLQ